MGTSYSQETAQSIIEQYKFRVEALSNRIEELQAQIEVSQIYKQNGQR
jgi:phosphopantetheine adenylyltransferase